MKRFKRLLVHLHGNPKDLPLIRYVHTFAALCESRHILWVMEGMAIDAMPAPVREALQGCQSIPSTLEPIPHANPEALTSLAASDGSDLIVVDRGSIPDKALRHLITQAPCSLLRVSPCSTPHFRKILVPVDFSAPSRSCVEIGANLARTRSINRLFLYHAVQIPLSWHRGSEPAPASTTSLIAPVKRKMEKLTAGIDPMGIQYDSHIMTALRPCLGVQHFEEQLQPDLMILNTPKPNGPRRTSATLSRILQNTHTTVLMFRSPRAGTSLKSKPLGSLACAT